MPNASSTSGRTAIVIGGGIAGIATARVLLDHFAHVTMIERDALVEGDEFRPGVPQGRQLHILLHGGFEIYETFFPGLRAELVLAGAESVVWGRDARWYHFGGWKRRNNTPFESLFCSRLLLEGQLRRRLFSSGRISIRDRSVASSLLVDRTAKRVTGVTVEPRDGGPRVELMANLVVDASGRESKAPVWLAAHGYEPPIETVVNANVGYASRCYRRRHDLPDWKLLIMHATPPGSSRAGVVVPIEGDRWIVALIGVAGDHPPTDEAAFLEFGRSLASPELYDAIRTAEPLSPIYGFRRTDNRLRRFDRLPRYLGGFLALGDAVCTFNPIYGQGMSIAALSASLLGECLGAGGGELDDLPGRFHKRLYRALAMPWFLATSEDFRYPTTIGERPPGALRHMQSFFDRILRLSSVDERAYDALIRVMHMTGSPAKLLHPLILLGVLSGRTANLPAHTTPADAGWSLPPTPAAP